MTAIVTRIESVRPHGENLSIVRVVMKMVSTIEGAELDGVNIFEVIANKRDDGSFRWQVGEPAVYVSEGSIIPDDVLKERGYWDKEKDRGLLDGGKRNRVKMKKLAGFESRGLLFKVSTMGQDWTDDSKDPEVVGWILRESLGAGTDTQYVKIGENVSEFFGITEFQG